MNSRTQIVDRIAATAHPEEGQLPAFVLTDPEVYQLELETIFQKAWLFVAHESEIPEKGDYVAREMGEQPVIVVRSEDGQIRVLLNVCRHRGMRIVRTDLGKTSHFRCPYHGFTYASDGRLTGVPYQRDAYGGALDKSTMGLYQARAETYKGLIFATWNHDGPSLDEFLGGMRWYLDILVGRTEMLVVGPPQKWTVPSAWKFPAENFVSDAYHTANTHASIAELYQTNPDFGKIGYHVNAGNGHGLGIGTQDDGPPFPPELGEQFKQHLSADQFELLSHIRNFHGNVFPNLSFLIPTLPRMEGNAITSTTIRQWQPCGPRHIAVYSWCLVEKDSPTWWKDLSRQAYIQTFGTSGIFEQDDTENWEFQTRNAEALLARDSDFMLNMTMGSEREPIHDFPGPGEVYDMKYLEANARAFYGEWRKYVLAGS
ncbi:MAG: aromatic ring-hydroxylating dioxygenase subunit alpha [Chloroflexi bacterium]|nr:aromatic ring-hydroxylating dioxygenase subunit alpha [Chloroflexota bacterium]